MDKFTTGYLDCALWSSTDNSTESGGYPLDDNYGLEDIAPEAMAIIVNDCKQFQESNDDLIGDDLADWGQAGHDFWLTRNGHGAGFWDGEWEKSGKALTAASKAFEECDMYVGDDGLLYI